MPVKRRGPPAKIRQTSFEPSGSSNGGQHVTGMLRVRNSPPPCISGGTSTGKARKSMIGETREDCRTIIDGLCSQPVIDAMMQNYIDVVHHIIPVVHLPTFRSDLEKLRYQIDRDFAFFILSMCATVVAFLPRRFDNYKRLDQNFAFSTRLEVVEHIQTLLNRLKPTDYYDLPTREKWATAYLLGRAYACLGLRQRLYFHHSEAQAFMTKMEFHQTRSYAALDNIETQLRRKAFWLTTIAYLHLRPENITWDSLSDRFFFDNTDAMDLIPLELDDEYITENELLEQPADKPALTVGFNALARVISCLVFVKRDPMIPFFHTTRHLDHPGESLGLCSCGQHIRPIPLSQLLKLRLKSSEKILDDLPAVLTLTNSLADINLSFLKSFQFASMGVNVHITHCWVQCLLVERMISLPEPSTEERNHLWQLQIEICSRLLNILEASSSVVLEPYGLLLPFKIRQVAATLLDCPLKAGSTSTIIEELVQAFSKILARLEESHAQN